MDALAAAGGAGAEIAIELVDGEQAVAAVAALGEGGAAPKPAAKRRVSDSDKVHPRADPRG
jgi:hypothetical protein